MSAMFADDAAAAEALANANSDDVTPVTPVAPVVEQAPVAAEDTSTVDAGTNLSESDINIDINSLPEAVRPEVQKAIDGYLRQADYTRKTQEIAPLRQVLTDAGMTAEEAQQALTFVQGLNDPEQLQKLYEHLQTQFDTEAAAVVDDGSVDPRDTELKNLSTRLERFEQAQAMSEAKQTLDTAVASVRAAHTDFQDADMNRVQQIAVAHMQGGTKDLSTAMSDAATEYADWKQQTLTDYINKKGQVSTEGTPVLGDTSHAETPSVPFANLEDATKAALARFGNSI